MPPIPDLQTEIPHEAQYARDCSIGYNDEGNMMILFKDEDGVIFAVAELPLGEGLRFLGNAQILVMEVVHGGQAHGQVGRA